MNQGSGDIVDSTSFKHERVAAIGDGGNDVSMIQAAHVGEAFAVLRY